MSRITPGNHITEDESHVTQHILFPRPHLVLSTQSWCLRQNPGSEQEPRLHHPHCRRLHPRYLRHQHPQLQHHYHHNQRFPKDQRRLRAHRQR